MTGRVALFLGGILVAVPVVVAAALFVPAHIPPNIAKPVLVTIPEGSPSAIIAKQMGASKVVGSPLLFNIALHLRGAEDELKAGEYAFPKGLSPFGAVSALRNGTYRSNEVSVTIPEGFNRQQIAARLAAADIVNEQEFLAATEHPTSELIALLPSLPAGATLEGYLFPDTYRFFKHTAPNAVVIRFVQTFMGKNATLPAPSSSAVGHTSNEIVILASILEREVKSEAERRIVADLFWRRIKEGIALQADITTAYAVGKTIEKLTPQDYANDSPYNTYQHRGLPPGPISNPGMVSLSAALNPTPNEYVYFLTKPGTGEAVFAKTLDEHNQNKALYLK